MKKSSLWHNETKKKKNWSFLWSLIKIRKLTSYIRKTKQSFILWPRKCPEWFHLTGFSVFCFILFVFWRILNQTAVKEIHETHLETIQLLFPELSFITKCATLGVHEWIKAYREYDKRSGYNMFKDSYPDQVLLCQLFLPMTLNGWLRFLHIFFYLFFWSISCRSLEKTCMWISLWLPCLLLGTCLMLQCLWMVYILFCKIEIIEPRGKCFSG